MHMYTHRHTHIYTCITNYIDLYMPKSMNTSALTMYVMRRRLILLMDNFVKSHLDPQTKKRKTEIDWKVRAGEWLLFCVCLKIM
jgi:hypothetical protein